MAEYTSIKASKITLNYLTALQGLFQYRYGQRYTLEDTILRLCLSKDMMEAFRTGILKIVKDKSDEESKRFSDDASNFFINRVQQIIPDDVELHEEDMYLKFMEEKYTPMLFQEIESLGEFKRTII